jgi:hypothetical protein
VTDEEFALAILCAHHSLKAFDSGNSDVDRVARELSERVHNRDTDGFVAVAATTGSGEVAGLISIVDVELVLVEGEPSDLGAAGTWIYYQLLVIDRRYQHSSLVDVLLAELARIGALRLAANPGHRGELASPFLLRSADRAGRSGLVAYLRNHGFRPVVGDPMGWWYRPRERTEAGDTPEPEG